MPGQNASSWGAWASRVNAPSLASSSPLAWIRLRPSFRSTSRPWMRSPASGSASAATGAAPAAAVSVDGAAAAPAAAASAAAISTWALSAPVNGCLFQRVPSSKRRSTAAWRSWLRFSMSARTSPRKVSNAGGMSLPSQGDRSRRWALIVPAMRSRPAPCAVSDCRSSCAARVDLSGSCACALALRSTSAVRGARSAVRSSSRPDPSPSSLAWIPSSEPAASARSTTWQAGRGGSDGAAGATLVSCLGSALPSALGSTLAPALGSGFLATPA